jgi:hypothetical protein
MHGPIVVELGAKKVLLLAYYLVVRTLKISTPDYRA